MRIAINARSFSNRGGIGRYARALSQHLIKLYEEDEFLLFGHPGTDLSFLQPAQNWKFISVPGPANRPYWETFLLKSAVNEEFPDIFHNPDYTVPGGINSPSTVTVHDLSFKYFPKGVSTKARIIYNLLTPPSLKKSDLVIADSYFTKNEIVRAGWKEENKIRVIHLAVNSDYLQPVPDEQIETVLKNHELERGYILYLGAIDRRKNVVGLIQAYAELRGRQTNIPKLVIAGQNIGGEAELMEWILQLGLGDHVKRIGYVPPDQLQAIYSGAHCFVFPSFYEGFGLPPLEAMACGVPVIVSDRASLPEVVGDAGIIVSIDDITSLTNAMGLLIEDPSTHADLSARGRERAYCFRWENVASRVMEVYLEIYEMHKTGPSHPVPSASK